MKVARVDKVPSSKYQITNKSQFQNPKFETLEFGICNLVLATVGGQTWLVQ